MCANFMAIYDVETLRAFFGTVVAGELPRAGESWPLGASPFIRLDENGRRRVESGIFGLLPDFAKEVAYGRNTYNARSETVETKNSFRMAWRHGQRCVIPAEHIFEPYYEPTLPHEPPSKPVRWKITAASGEPLTIAGLYNTWRGPDGLEQNTFTMLTVNADFHPFMSRFHAPGDEKRMVVILDPEEIDDWLTCSPEEARRYFRMWGGALTGVPAPLQPRAPKTKADKPAPPRRQDDLFGC